MAFVMIFWAAYLPFVILLRSLVGRYAMRALGSLQFERLPGDGASPTLASRRPASAYLPNYARQASCNPTGDTHSDTSGVRSLFALPLHHAATIACQRTIARASRLVRGSASPPRPGLGQPKAIRTSSALR